MEADLWNLNSLRNSHFRHFPLWTRASYVELWLSRVSLSVVIAMVRIFCSKLNQHLLAVEARLWLVSFSASYLAFLPLKSKESWEGTCFEPWMTFFFLNAWLKACGYILHSTFSSALSLLNRFHIEWDTITKKKMKKTPFNYTAIPYTKYEWADFSNGEKNINQCWNRCLHNIYFVNSVFFAGGMTPLVTLGDTELALRNNLTILCLNNLTQYVMIRSQMLVRGVRTFRPMPFQPLQFQPLQFQPFTHSTACHFNGVQFQPRAISTTANSTAPII